MRQVKIMRKNRLRVTVIDDTESERMSMFDIFLLFLDSCYVGGKNPKSSMRRIQSSAF